MKKLLISLFITLASIAAAHSQSAYPANFTFPAVRNTATSYQNQTTQNNYIATRGIASTGAIAGLPALEADKNFGFGVGVGNYASTTGVAVGGQARITSSTVLKIGAGTTNFGGLVTNAGLGISF